MRFFVSLAIALMLLPCLTTALDVAAQDQSLLDLLPDASAIGPDVVVAENRQRALDDQATGFSDAIEADRLLAGWHWQGNAFKVFQSTELTPSGAPVATLDISLTRFASATDAAAALPYFMQDRIAVLGQRPVQNSSQGAIGDEARAIDGTLSNGAYDHTVFARSGPLVMRVSATALANQSLASPEQIAQSIIQRAGGQPLPQPAIVNQSLADYLPATLPVADATCAAIDESDELDVPTMLERYDGVANAESTLTGMGWEKGINRQFGCDVTGPDGVGWVTVGVLGFADAPSAQDAVAFLASARAANTRLAAAPAIALGDRSAALTGAAPNGTEYTLYASRGPLLFRVTGVAPMGDPRSDVEAIAAALFERPSTDQEEPPHSVPATFIAATATVTATPVPFAQATTLPTPLPLPTATPMPLPTATPIPPPTMAPRPTDTPVPNTISVPAPTAPPTTAPPIATATLSGAPPTPTPRVIHPPTPEEG
jgi:hypothetical protein